MVEYVRDKERIMFRILYQIERLRTVGRVLEGAAWALLIVVLDVFKGYNK